MVKNRKNPQAAAVASFFIAGLGHVYNGESRVKGAVFFAGRLAGVVLFILYATIYDWVISHSAYFADMLPPTRYFFFVYVLLVIIPWIFVALYDAYIVLSTARKMNDGEIPFRENNRLTCWTYALAILFLTIVFILTTYLFFFKTV
jgi:heme/copper-type cytochrome/quinol oxidase subunit 2